MGYGAVAVGAALLVLVHRDPWVVDAAIEQLQAALGWPVVSIEQELAVELAAASERRRARGAERWLADRLRPLAPGPVCLMRTDLLFEPSLGLELPTLLLRLGRQARLVVGWPGEVGGDGLGYAIPGHSHHRVWRRPALVAVEAS